MNKQELKTYLIESIKQIAGVSENELCIEASFSDNGIDSLDLIELIMKIETDFMISIPDEDTMEMMQNNIDDLADYLLPVIQKQTTI